MHLITFTSLSEAEYEAPAVAVEDVELKSVFNQIGECLRRRFECTGRKSVLFRGVAAVTRVTHDS